MRGLRVAVWLPVLLATGFAGVAEADPVTLRAAAHDGYGRLVFNWESPVQHSAAISGGRLVVRFNRTIEADFAGSLRALSPYMSEIRIEPDGMTVTARLKGDFVLRNFDLGAAVVIDLLNGVPPPPSAAASRLMAEPVVGSRSVVPDPVPQVPIRTGIHDGFSRIVFDWPERVTYRVEREGDATSIVFDRPAKVDLSELQQRQFPLVSGVRADTRDGRLVVTLRTAPGTDVRHFLSGPKVVVDVAAGSRAPDAKPAAPGAEAPGGRRPIALRPQADVKPAAEADGKAGAKAPEPARATPAAPEPKPGARPAAAPAAPAVLSAPVGKPETPLESATLRIDWQEPTGAAVFRRAGNLWVVFDRAAAIDVAGLKATGGNLLRAVQQMPASRGAVLRLETAAGVNPNLRRDGVAWLLDFRKQELAPQAEIEVKPQPESPVGTRVFIPVPEPGEVIVLNDPEVGDVLAVVPVIPLGHGISVAYDYPQFQILDSAQGVVIRPRVDTLRVRSLRQGVEITGAQPLALTGVTKQAEASSKLASALPMTRIFDFEPWREGGFDHFTEDKHQLLQAIAKSQGPIRERGRLDLARFYTAHGMGAEAIGVLDLSALERADIQKDPEYRALHGAANVLLTRYDEAAKDFDDRGLDENDEVLFWRAVGKARAGDLAGTAADLTRRGMIIRDYPAQLKIPLGMLITEAAEEVGDIRQAKRFSEVLAAETLSPAQRGTLAYLKGRLNELSGAFDDAVFEWEKAIASPHRPSRARAAMARSELLLKLQKIKTSEAIEELEKLRFAWRGDDFEVNLLRRLADLYMRENDYGAGLRTLRQLATNFREHPSAKQVSEDMASAFSHLYLDGGADALAPVTAIALYDEFRELTPAGEKGDEMIRKLADRLVFVDLLGRAAELLENQIKFRLEAVQKARVGARLALVRILDRLPQKAIEALDMSDAPNLDADLVRQRRHLRARAYVSLSDMDKALDLLKGDESVDAARIRAEIHWQTKDWIGAAAALAKVAEDSGAAPNKPLDESQGRHVLNLAIALTLSGNERAVVRLRENYDAAMAQTGFKDAFRLIASPQTLGIIDYRTIASRVNDAENFQTFLTGYKEKLRTGSLSQIN